MVNLADLMPKDQPDLMACKEEWCHDWVKLLADLEKCSMDGKTHNLSLALAPEESAKGCKAEEAHIHFHEQIHTFKIKAECQAKECAHLEEEKQLKEKGKGKEKNAAGEDFVMEDGQEEAISEDEEPNSPVCIEKCKLPEGEDLEDFDLLVNANVSDEDLLMEGQVRALYARVSTMHGMMLEVMNELDVIAIYYKKRRWFL
ncbi:uncharacterized protein BJ212DRAFT_1490861 [Suillus subaureus]|uniref:Uncharacterized protein n=1 Tax=Suillus subaureus TaxID=48587 RepID=A0A9P7ALF9_9AGAM|nr:uncharacterized protein BJ212DRAFT_1490861 [Suillus subaureus]KAG1791790.1 hypothetical protein BJ212DRAFT_1490861 [Suillus subaureus]